ncbi:hotdog fold thioesterase [Leucobacter chinensis]|uniref:hotdog fold thioesterase n=1 Tax=Leucobacter chinensis TaxID=2851010 RepID=UPI001C21FA21|nr:hotdog fold thioesterase [Leucobacter chinensis]
MTQHTPAENLDGLEFVRTRGLGALADRMGITMKEFSRERAVATMPVDGNTQPIGLLHGGAYCVLGETLGSMHSNLIAPKGKVGVGIDINATHTGSATSGSVTAVCTPIHVGRSLSVHEIVISDEAGRRCSTVRITNMYKDLPSN